jgi:hypothetical protein
VAGAAQLDRRRQPREVGPNLQLAPIEDVLVDRQRQLGYEVVSRDGALR